MQKCTNIELLEKKTCAYWIENRDWQWAVIEIWAQV